MLAPEAPAAPARAETPPSTELPSAPEAPAAPPARAETPSRTAPPSAPASPGQGFRALTERWTRERVERVVALLHAGDRTALEGYLEREVPRVPHPTDPPDQLDLKGISFASL
ncbi:MAG TPA: hypothetical protein VFS00_09860, partial [Polyangiaceae bacterium]|nr:hypothetical protein [Polyangiaceae bacterium]